MESLTRGEAAVFAELQANDGVFLSNRALHKKTGYCTRQVVRILHRLEEKQLVSSGRPKTGGRGHTNQYRPKVALDCLTPSNDSATVNPLSSPTADVILSSYLKGDKMSSFSDSDQPSMSSLANPTDDSAAAGKGDKMSSFSSSNRQGMSYFERRYGHIDLSILDTLPDLKGDKMSSFYDSSQVSMSSFSEVDPEVAAAIVARAKQHRAMGERLREKREAAIAASRAIYAKDDKKSPFPASKRTSMSSFASAATATPPACAPARGDLDPNLDTTEPRSGEGVVSPVTKKYINANGNGVVARNDHAPTRVAARASEEMVDGVPVRLLDKLAAAAGFATYNRSELAQVYNLYGWTLRDYGFSPSQVAEKCRKAFYERNPNARTPFGIGNLRNWLHIEVRDTMREYAPSVAMTTRPFDIQVKYRKQLVAIENEAQRKPAAAAV